MINAELNKNINSSSISNVVTIKASVWLLLLLIFLQISRCFMLRVISATDQIPVKSSIDKSIRRTSSIPFYSIRFSEDNYYYFFGPSRLMIWPKKILSIWRCIEGRSRLFSYVLYSSSVDTFVFKSCTEYAAFSDTMSFQKILFPYGKTDYW